MLFHSWTVIKNCYHHHDCTLVHTCTAINATCLLLFVQFFFNSNTSFPVDYSSIYEAASGSEGLLTDVHGGSSKSKKVHFSHLSVD